MVGELTRNSRAIPETSGLDCGGPAGLTPATSSLGLRRCHHSVRWRAALRDRQRTANGLAPSSFTVTPYFDCRLLTIRLLWRRWQQVGENPEEARRVTRCPQTNENQNIGLASDAERRKSRRSLKFQDLAAAVRRRRRNRLVR